MMQKECFIVHTTRASKPLYTNVSSSKVIERFASLLRDTCLYFSRLYLALLLSPVPSYATLPTQDLTFQKLLGNSYGNEEFELGIVETIIRDTYGFMWFGTESGIVSYDGQTMKAYYKKEDDINSLCDDHIYDLTIDHNGGLWIATTMGLCRYNHTKDNFSQFFNVIDKDNPLSSRTIQSIDVDNKNRLWIGTTHGLGIFDIASETLVKIIQRPSNNDSRLKKYNIASVYVDEHNPEHIWVGTFGEGLDLFNLDGERLAHWDKDQNTNPSINWNWIIDTLRDDDGSLWIAYHGGGLDRLSADGSSIKHYVPDDNTPNSLSTKTLKKLTKDSKGNIWISTDHGGLQVYNPATDDFQSYRPNSSKKNSLSSGSVRTVYEDTLGDLWVGLFPSGINYVDASHSRFKHWTHDSKNPNTIINNEILFLLEDKQNHLYIGTERGLSIVNRQTNTYSHFTKKSTNGALHSNSILAIHEDSHGHIWLGTWAGGLHKFNKKNQTIEKVSLPKSINQKTYADPLYIWSLEEDDKGNLWIGTQQNGVFKLHLDSQTLTHFTPSEDAQGSISTPYVSAIFLDSQNTLWLGTNEGVDMYIPNKNNFSNFPILTGKKDKESNFDVISFFEDSRHRIWIGSKQTGIAVISANRKNYTIINKKNGLSSLKVAGIQESNNGIIWVSTLSGIDSINPDTLQVISHYDESHGIAGNKHARNASYKDRDGHLYFGGSQGITQFDPHNVIDDTTIPPVYLTGLSIFNKEIKPNDTNAILDTDIKFTKKISLPYSKNIFTIDFALLSYRSPSKNLYSYKLAGFDKSWRKAGKKTSATYTNLDPGTYTFNVRGANRDGIWNIKGATLEIKITPPYWQTWWAYLFYLMFFLGLSSLLLHLKSKQFQLKTEQDINAKLVKLDKLKDSFLASTSHELRTPLNGIIGITETLLDKNSGNDFSIDTQRKLNLVITSGRRLANLINDILDYSGLQKQSISLNLSGTNVYLICNRVLELLLPLAQVKRIQLINKISQTHALALADEQRLQQILINLIGNAIKYSDDGVIEIFSKVNEDKVSISVKDDGIGIPKEKQTYIFKAFHQIDSGETRAYEGTGLGLTVTKQLVELHGGDISIESDGRHGSIFTFTLNRSDKSQTNKQNNLHAIQTQNKNPDKKTGSQKALKNQQTKSYNTQESNKKLTLHLTPPHWAKSQTVLIVDDDPVNLIVLEGILTLHNYRILSTSNGADALALLDDQNEINLIITDLMMPRMTGFELCEHVRKKYAMHQLPIIILTAKSKGEDLDKGIDVGCNDFLNKPVDKSVLLSKVKMLLSMTKGLSDT